MFIFVDLCEIHANSFKPPCIGIFGPTSPLNVIFLSVPLFVDCGGKYFVSISDFQ